jgi:hypothetical protein
VDDQRKPERPQDRGESLKESVDMLLQKDQLERSQQKVEKSRAGSKPGASLADDPGRRHPRTE